LSITWSNERVRLGDLVPWPRNPRQIKRAQAEKLLDSVDTFGQVETLAVGPDNDVYNGHQRLNVLMQEHGPDFVVDVRRASRALTEKEREKLTVYLHKGAAGEWDFDTLANEFDVDELLEWGFEDFELGIDANMDSAGEDTEPEIDRAEELRQQWGVELGQMWQLGEHRLICGDCTDADVVARVMGEERAAVCFTSPPYNAGVSAQLSGNTSIGDNLYRGEYNDNQSQDDWLKMMCTFTDQAMRVSRYVFVNVQILAGNKRAFVEYWWKNVDRFADVAVWDKQHAAPQQAQRVMDSRFEFILVLSHDANRAVGTRNFRGMVHNVYSGAPQRDNKYASSLAATFPIDLPEHFIGTFSNIGDTIYEPFSGSGTTIIACENLGRKCSAVEISPAYVAVALERWAQHTGRTPELIDA